MAHYAFLDENNIVTGVIVGKEEGTDGIDWEQKYGEIKGQTCKRTSYNTRHNEHSDGGTPFRGNYAGIGYTYDEVNDVFIGPKPVGFDSFILNESTWSWEAPVTMPELTEEQIAARNYYIWNEETTSWVLVEDINYDR
jgi:hypothetical protein